MYSSFAIHPLPFTPFQSALQCQVLDQLGQHTALSTRLALLQSVLADREKELRQRLSGTFAAMKQVCCWCFLY